MLILPYRCIYVYTSIRQYKFTLTQITLQTLLITPFSVSSPWRAFQAFFGVPFQTTALSHQTDGGTNSDKASWNLLLSMFSLPFGLSPCQFLSFLRHRQPFLQLTVHPVSGLNRSGGIFVLRCPCAFPDTVSGVSPLSFYILSPPSTSNPFMRSFHFSDKSDIHFPLQS